MAALHSLSGVPWLHKPLSLYSEVLLTGFSAPSPPRPAPCSTDTPLPADGVAANLLGPLGALGLPEHSSPRTVFAFAPASAPICFGWKNKPFCCCGHFKGTRRATRYPLERRTRNGPLFQMR